MGLDEIGKLDHHADIMGKSLLAAILAARAGTLDRKSYLRYFRDVLVLLNMAAPAAFGCPDDAPHKQKRRLANWLVAARVHDALIHDAVDRVEAGIGEVDRALWMHFQDDTGDIVVWEPEPRHRVLGTTWVKPEVLMKALNYREEMDRGEMLPILSLFLNALEIDAVSVFQGKQAGVTPPSVS